MAGRLARDLVEESINVWLDEWEILIGDSITQRVQQGLQEVDFVILLLTKHSVGSGWAEKEWQSQVGLEAERKQVRILPVRADSCEVPLLLRDKKCADVSSDYEKGLSELLRAIRGHLGKQMGKPGGPPAVNKSSPRRLRARRWQAALVALVLLATASFIVYRANVAETKVYELDLNNSATFYPKKSKIVPPAESYRIREVYNLPTPDYSGFTVIEDRRVIDLRDWKPFAAGADGRISPVTWSRMIRLQKIKEAEQIRFAFATGGSGIDAAVVSGQDYYLETAVTSCDPPQLLLITLQAVVNVAQYNVGEEFEIEIRATFWNGSPDQEDWTAYTVYAPVKVVSMLILFPQRKAFKWKKLVMYRPGSPDELPPPDSQRNSINSPDNRNLYWKIREPIPGNTYEIQWGW